MEEENTGRDMSEVIELSKLELKNFLFKAFVEGLRTSNKDLDSKTFNRWYENGEWLR